MNVAIISPELPPYSNWGGIATFNENLAKMLVSLGHKVYVFTYKDGLENEVAEKVGPKTIVYVRMNFGFKFINFFYFLFPGGLIRKVMRRFFPTLLFLIDWNIFSFLSFKRHYKCFNIQLIHTPTYYASALLTKAIYKKIPLILHDQGPQILLNRFEPNSIDNRVKALIEAAYTRFMGDVVIPCSRNVKNYLISTLNISPNKVFIIQNFIDTAIFKPTKLTTNTNLIVFIGRLEYRKGPDITFRAFCKLAINNNKLRVVFIGEDLACWKHEHKPLTFQEWAKKNSHPDLYSRMTFIDRVNDKRVLSKILEKYNGVAVLPSRYEPFGFVYVEAMAKGLIVIASKNGGGAEIIKSGVEGFTALPETASIYSCLRRIHRLNKSDLQMICNNAQKKVKLLYSKNSARQRYERLYETILNGI